MEPRHGAQEDLTVSSRQQRLRIWAVCSVLAGLVFIQAPGLVVTDTKLDLTANPVGWLGRALHLWEPHGWLGQVQNQAYGYLFPMGPFFALGHLLALPEWVVQRLWTSLLLCLAVVGVARLAGRLRIGTPTAALAAGVLYALSPRFLTTLGANSAETLPMALAPWIVLPLVGATISGRHRSGAARSGLVVLACGAVNAVATLAVLVIPATYLVTRERNRARLRLMVLWAAAVLAATFWWLVPLVLLGGVSPPFLDWIESARITTIPTNLVETLRGTSHWVAFVLDRSGPFWQGGWLLVTNPVAILDTGLVAGLGLYGLARRDLPERRWLALTALVGVVAVTFGHVGPLAAPWAAWAQGLLDGVLAPMRNIHKFDPLIRLPLTLAAAHALTVLGRQVNSIRAPGLRSMSVGLAGVVMIGVASPLLLESLPPRDAFSAIPGYWQDTADWLAKRSDGAAIVVPGASFGTFYWGDPRDEPLQPLAGTPWTVRDAVPLAPAGTIRWLDGIEDHLAGGQGGPGLTALFRRAGIRYVVVRNDLDYTRAESPRPVLVHAALSGSPGVAKVAQFGGVVGGGSRPGFRVDEGLDLPYRAVEVYEVAEPRPRFELQPVAGAAIVSGDSTAVADLADAGFDSARSLVMAGDVPTRWTGWVDRPSDVIQTDTYRRREVNFGRVHDHSSQTLGPDDPLRLGSSTRDYLPYPDAFSTVAVPMGGEVRASSSQSDAGAPGGSDPEHQPFAAVDGDSRTTWSSSAPQGALGQWIELTADHPVSGIATVRVNRDVFGLYPTSLRVTGEHGSVDVAVDDPLRAVRVEIPGGTTRTIRVEPLQISDGGRGVSFVVADLRLPGVVVRRPLQLPRAAAGTDRIVLTAAADRPGCVLVGSRPLCSERLVRGGEEDTGMDRLLSGISGSWRISGTAVPKPGPALDAWLAPAEGIRAAASSSNVQDPRGGAQRAVDGRLETGWVAAPGDRTPNITLTWEVPRIIRGLSVRLDPALAASAPTMVSALGDNGIVQRAPVGSDNIARFHRGIVTSSLVVSFPAIRPEGSIDPFTGRSDLLPVGVSELMPLGAQDLVRPDDGAERLLAPCGTGPTLYVDGRFMRTAVTGTRSSIMNLQPQEWSICGPATVSLGDNARISTKPSLTWRAAQVRLDARGISPAPQPIAPTGPLTVLVDNPDERKLGLPERTSAQLLSVLENANAGWVAHWSDGSRLEPVTLDGWHQGWVVPAGAPGTVTLTYAPQRTYALGLTAGLVLALGLLVLALRPDRRPGHRLAPAGATSSDRVVYVLALGWLAGAVGLVFGLAAMAAKRVRWFERVRPFLAGGLFVIAGLGFVFRPWTAPAGYAGLLGWPQAVALGALALAVLPLSTHQVPEALRGTLNEDPAQPGGDQAEAESQDEHLEEVAGEGLLAQEPEDDVQQ